MVQEITLLHTPEEGRAITNQNVRELFGRAGQGPRERIWLPSEPVALGPTTGWYDLGLEFQVEVGVMYRFHASIFFILSAPATVGFSVLGPGTIITPSFPERLAYWTRVNRTSLDDGWEHSSRYQNTGSNHDFASSEHTQADVWGFIKPNQAGTLQVLGRRNAGSANVFLPTCLEWW